MKRVLFLGLLLMFSSKAFSQESNVKIGLQLSATNPSFINNYIDNEFRLSYATGLTFDYQINDNLSLMSGFGYERKGSKSHITVIDQNNNLLGKGDINFNYDYIGIPLMLIYHSEANNGIYFGGGSYATYLLKATSNSKIEIFDNQVFTEDTNRVDIGLALVVGYVKPLSENIYLDIAIREYYGLSKLDKHATKSRRNSSIGIQFALKFAINGN